MEFNIALGNLIRTIRQNHRITQEELAYKCGLHRTYIGQVERGEKNITIKNLNKIAHALGISLADVFENFIF